MKIQKQHPQGSHNCIGTLWSYIIYHLSYFTFDISYLLHPQTWWPLSRVLCMSHNVLLLEIFTSFDCNKTIFDLIVWLCDYVIIWSWFWLWIILFFFFCKGKCFVLCDGVYVILVVWCRCVYTFSKCFSFVHFFFFFFCFVVFHFRLCFVVFSWLVTHYTQQFCWGVCFFCSIFCDKLFVIKWCIDNDWKLEYETLRVVIIIGNQLYIYHCTREKCHGFRITNGWHWWLVMVPHLFFVWVARLIFWQFSIGPR